MKRLTFIILFSALTFFIFSFGLNHLSFNKKKVEEVVILYINNISKIYQQESYYNSYGAIDELFTEEITPLHFNDIKPYKTKSVLNEYFRDIEKVLDDNVVVNISNIQIYPCSYFDSSNAESYAIATCEKTISINGNKKKYDLLIQIDLSNYKIFSVYSRERHMNMLPQCKLKEKDNNYQKENEKRKQIEKQAKEFLDNGNNLYKAKKYIEAKRWYKAVLELVPNNITAKNRIKDCEQLIDSKLMRERVEDDIRIKNYSSAQQLLQEMKKANYVFSNDWFTKQQQICKIGIRQQKFNSIVSTGDYYYNNHMFYEAKKQYKKALNLHVNNKLILNKINLCNSGNPNYARNEIRKAYNNAVKSKKYWLNTFKTYLKYEKSGFLTGENYYFMTLMMLENKKVAKAMGYSKSLASSLSVEYYFKAKRLGCKKCDMAFLENQVFTNSIYKH